MAAGLAQNTTVQDFRVRGGAQWVTRDVLDTYTELLSDQNFTLTCCDLMKIQGDRIDELCRLNRLGRGILMERLPDIKTREQWLDEILIPLKDDLDSLVYWNQLQPVFLSRTDEE